MSFPINRTESTSPARRSASPRFGGGSKATRAAETARANREMDEQEAVLMAAWDAAHSS